MLRLQEKTKSKTKQTGCRERERVASRFLSFKAFGNTGPECPELANSTYQVGIPAEMKHTH